MTDRTSPETGLAEAIGSLAGRCSLEVDRVLCIKVANFLHGHTPTPDLREADTEEYRYARNMLVHFVEEHFPHNPDWRPLPDLIGVLTQIDNAITIARDYKARIVKMERALNWIVNSPSAHPANMVKVAETALQGPDTSTGRAPAKATPWPAKGDRMIFLNENGYPEQRKRAAKVFEVGKEYEVDACDVQDWSHSVCFVGVEGWHNGVMFKKVAVSSPVHHTKGE